MDKAGLLKQISEQIAKKGCGQAYVEMYADFAQIQHDPAQLAEQLYSIIENALIDLQQNGETVETPLKRFVLGQKIKQCTKLLTLVELVLDE